MDEYWSIQPTMTPYNTCVPSYIDQIMFSHTHTLLHGLYVACPSTGKVIFQLIVLLITMSALL